MSEASDDAATIAILTQLKSCVRQCLYDPSDAAALEEEDEDMLSLSAEAVYLAWVMSLSAHVRRSGDLALTAARLDESMLFVGTDDDMLSGMSGGLADGPSVREVLKKLKATLPAGQLLPDAVREALEEDGITVA